MLLHNSTLSNHHSLESLFSGPTAATKIREAGCDVFIIGVTGNVMPADVKHYMSCGANAVLPKPLKVSDVDSLWMEYGVYNNSQGTSNDETTMFRNDTACKIMYSR